MISCPACGEPMSKICGECGAFFDEPEYLVYDLYNYRALPKRCYRREDHFKEVLAQFQGCEGKELPRQLLDQIKAELAKTAMTLREQRVLSRLGKEPAKQVAHSVAEPPGRANNGFAFQE